MLYVHQYAGVVYHSHLGEVDQVVLSVIGCPLLDEGQVSQVHSQVGNTGRVTAKDTKQVRERQQLYQWINMNEIMWICEHFAGKRKLLILTSSKLLSGFWIVPLMTPASVTCRLQSLSRKWFKHNCYWQKPETQLKSFNYISFRSEEIVRITVPLSASKRACSLQLFYSTCKKFYLISDRSYKKRLKCSLLQEEKIPIRLA